MDERKESNRHGEENSEPDPGYADFQGYLPGATASARIDYLTATCCNTPTETQAV
jgi:hypothetical protein